MPINLIDKTRDNFAGIGQKTDALKETRLTADSGCHSEKNMEMIFTEEIAASIADNQFRKRDPRFSDYDRYKERHGKELGQRSSSEKLFSPEDFIFTEDFSHCICPVGKRLYRSGSNVTA